MHVNVGRWLNYQMIEFPNSCTVLSKLHHLISYQMTLPQFHPPIKYSIEFVDLIITLFAERILYLTHSIVFHLAHNFHASQVPIKPLTGSCASSRTDQLFN